MIQRIKKSYWILLCGVLWGIIEATFGWVIHLAHLNAMTPLLILAGVFCMALAYRKTGSTNSVMAVSGIAAALKTLNLFLLTWQSPLWVLKPAMHILCEGLAVFVLLCSFHYYNKRKTVCGMTRTVRNKS